MTPEERVASIDYFFPGDLSGEEGDRAIANAIREAMQDEREACAKYCDKRIACLEEIAPQDDHNRYQYEILELKDIADLIRKRVIL